MSCAFNSIHETKFYSICESWSSDFVSDNYQRYRYSYRFDGGFVNIWHALSCSSIEQDLLKFSKTYLLHWIPPNVRVEIQNAMKDDMVIKSINC